MIGPGQVMRAEIGPLNTQAQCEKFAAQWLETIENPIVARCEQRG